MVHAEVFAVFFWMDMIYLITRNTKLAGAAVSTLGLAESQHQWLEDSHQQTQQAQTPTFFEAKTSPSDIR